MAMAWKNVRRARLGGARGDCGGLGVQQGSTVS
jgi:hypothetical protein